MRRQQHLKQFIDLIGHSKWWPARLRQLMFGAQHLTNQDRFKITVFLLCNGVSPQLIKAFFTQCFNLDAAAHRQINWIIQQYPTSRWTAWNVSEQRSI